MDNSDKMRLSYTNRGCFVDKVQVLAGSSTKRGYFVDKVQVLAVSSTKRRGFVDKCEVQSDCFVIRESKIKCAYPRGREIAFSILNTTLHSPQKHFPGLKTAIPCPGAT